MKTTSVTPTKSNIKEDCVSSCLNVLGNKWTALILTELTSSPKRFGELEHALPGISPRTLSQRLEDLVGYKIITKKAYAEVPPKVEYTLTAKGHDFMPVLRQMEAWGTKYSS